LLCNRFQIGSQKRLLSSIFWLEPALELQSFRSDKKLGFVITLAKRGHVTRAAPRFAGESELFSFRHPRALAAASSRGAGRRQASIVLTNCRYMLA
jgi:hypothetical protein